MKGFRDGTATNSILLMLVNIVTTLLGMAVTKLLSVHFSLSDYGTYSQTLLINNTATSISILGLTNATNFFYNKTTNNIMKKKYISTIFSMQYTIGLLCGLVIICLRNPIASYFGNNRLTKTLFIIMLTPMLSNLISMYQVLFLSIGEAKKLAARSLVVAAIRLVVVLIACFVLKSISIVLIIVLILDIGQVLYFSLMFKHDKYPITVKNFDISLIKEILAFSIPMAIYVLTNSLSRDIDKYVIGAFSNTETLAVYSNAARILPFDLLTNSLIVVLVPIITRFINQNKFEEAKTLFALYLRMGCLLTCIFVGGAIGLAKYVMLFLYDKKYLAGLSVFIVYLIVDMIKFANVTTILSGAGKTKILMYISIATLGANLVLNIIAYKTFGIIGPAIVTLLLTISMTVTLLFFGSRVIKTTIIKLFDLKEIFIVGTEILIVGIEIHFLSDIISKHSVPLFFNLFICYGLYLAILLGINYRRVYECFNSLNSYK